MAGPDSERALIPFAPPALVPPRQRSAARRSPGLALLVLLAACAAPAADEPVHQRGLWVWTNLPALEAADQEALLAFASEAGVTTLYQQAQKLVYSKPKGLAGLIGAAGRTGFEVELLIGDHAWAGVANHPTVLQIVRDLVLFRATLPEPRPTALHLDAEPHTQPLWKVDRQLAATELLDLLDAVRVELAGSGLLLVYDMPNWYDSVDAQRDGQTRPLSEWVQDRVDRVVLMDYRDEVEVMLDLAEDELDYARVIGKTVVVGFETKCGQDPKIIWCEEGQAALAAAMVEVHAQLQDHAGYGGVAVHHYGAWQQLGP